MVISGADERRVRTAVATTRSALLELTRCAPIIDVALIGSAGGTYRWTPSRIVDFDCFVFVEALDNKAGTALQNLNDDLVNKLGKTGVDFELRIIRGSYKPNRTMADPPILLLHLGVFTDDSYLQEEACKRWAWRKYICQVEESRLARLAPSRPSLEDLLYGPRGVVERLADLNRGKTAMCEWLLPDLNSTEITIDHHSSVFVEFCYGSAATTARNHARILGYPEADRLENDQFFSWYQETVLPTKTLLPLMEMKRRARDEGATAGDTRPRELCTSFLKSVLAAILTA